tara:strand:+ start:280 stop:711 length:432 start_codon:yes stop_codon:yes gene_type:complete
MVAIIKKIAINNEIMISIQKNIYQGLILFLIFFLIFFSNSFRIFAEEIEWLEVSKTDNDLLYINPDSIKYNNRGFLSVVVKYSVIDPDDQNIINEDPSIMVIDCENRLFSKFPANADIKQVKHWENPINNKSIKKAIINSCSY